MKTLLTYGLYDSEQDVTYMFKDDLRGRDQYSYDISNSRGEKTHKITLQYVRTSDGEYPRILVNNYRAAGKVKLYRGQFHVYRGCNEIKEIQIEW